MTDTVKHMWDEVEKARADGTFSSEHAAVPAQDAGACEHCDFVAWRWRWGEKDFWKYTDLNGPGIPSTAYQVEPLYTDGGSSLRTPAACEQPDIDTLAQFIRDAEREHGQCDDDDTYLSYRPTARAILQKFDVRPK